MLKQAQFFHDFPVCFLFCCFWCLWFFAVNVRREKRSRTSDFSVFNVERTSFENIMRSFAQRFDNIQQHIDHYKIIKGGPLFALALVAKDKRLKNPIPTTSECTRSNQNRHHAQ